jgi:aldehyde dehydrogenase (NAD+)
MNYIRLGQEEGAKVEIGGKRVGSVGYFIEPTIFSDVKEDMKIMQEEIFGPVASIAKFGTVEDAIALGNKTTFGLAAAVHTKNIETALNVANSLRAGTVWINTYNLLSSAVPFGGFKESGIGRELGKAALANYTQTKSVMVNIGGATP